MYADVLTVVGLVWGRRTEVEGVWSLGSLLCCSRGELY